MDFKLRPIGTVHSPFSDGSDIHQEQYWSPEGFDPIQGELEIYPEFVPGLESIEGFSHLIVLFAFQGSKEGKLHALPPFETRERGVFATRSPHRPNPLGMTVLRLMRRRGNILEVGGLDMIEGTVILDIKPYTPRDRKTDARFGWLERTCR